ncbi:MAG: FKBP-type peptidyl-prolyl cis-trans isomerase, partial [Fimbriimonadales bacterium]
GMFVRTKFLQASGISDPLVEATVGGSGGGTQRLVYGFDSGRPVLVRIDPPTWYGQSHYAGGLSWGDEPEPAWERRVSYKSGVSIGPEPPAYSKSQCLAALRGENTVRKLGALVWLDGIHSQPDEKVEEVAKEPVPLVAPYWALVRDPDVVSAIRQQRASKIPWVSEAANLFASLHPRIENPASKKRERKLTDKLGIKDIVVGKGTEFSNASPLTPGGLGVFEYVGKLPDGTVFDANEGRFHCAQINLSSEGAMCPEGLRQGLIGMRPGGVRRIVVPASMAFGSVGAGKVPPNSDVVYRVRLLHNASRAPRSGHDIRIGTGQVAAGGMTAAFHWKAWYLNGQSAELKMENPSSVNLISPSYPDNFPGVIVGMRRGGVRRALISGFTLLKDSDFGCTDLIVEIRLDWLSGAASQGTGG